ncbi:hypothetical protein N0V94_002830 [Neodidymelliopsis sp. IMI 364377]|nr:hypothetical protein N0V94_002830 [Neodidymelliopsis sp. IMI 364377]
MHPAVMNQIQRDDVKLVLPGFRTSGHECVEDPDAYTNHLTPGAYLEKKLKGYTVPTFEDLLRGLSYLPSGMDARELTQCLSWYLGVRDTFHPKLELSVLHTQALTRALRLPLELIGSQNLDKIALQEWQDNGTFEKVKIMSNEPDTAAHKNGTNDAAQPRRSQAIFDISDNLIDLKLHVNISIRHVLTFPFLALHGAVGEALQLGVRTSERRRIAREGPITPRTPRIKREAQSGTTPRSIAKKPRAFEERYAERTPTKIRPKESFSAQTPKRPTVSPITPRTASRYGAPWRPTKLQFKVESSPLKRGRTQESP